MATNRNRMPQLYSSPNSHVGHDNKRAQVRLLSPFDAIVCVAHHCVAVNPQPPSLEFTIHAGEVQNIWTNNLINKFCSSLNLFISVAPSISVPLHLSPSSIAIGFLRIPTNSTRDLVQGGIASTSNRASIHRVCGASISMYICRCMNLNLN